ncbi:hypothetical protein D3C84_1182450 [compost metagenome]
MLPRLPGLNHGRLPCLASGVQRRSWSASNSLFGAFFFFRVRGRGGFASGVGLAVVDLNLIADVRLPDKGHLLGGFGLTS